MKNRIFIVLRFATLAHMLCVLCAVPALAQPQLSGAQSDTLDAGIYDVVGDIWVNSEDTWQLMPGVELRFYGDTSLDVDGRLYSLGTESDSIRFVRRFDDQPWGGIRLDNNGRTGKFDYCVITGSNEIGLTVEHYGSLRLYNSRISDNSDINEVAGGIWWQSPVIDSLKNVTVSDNIGPGIVYRLGRLHLRDCEISGNTGSGVYTYGAQLDFSNVLFMNNGNSGVWIGTSSSGTIDSCSFIGNTGEYGAGCRQQSSGLYLSRTLFKNNHADIEGGGLYSEDYTNPIVVHCVFDGNSSSNTGSAISVGSSQLINSVISSNYNADCAVMARDSWTTFCQNNDFYGNDGGDLIQIFGDLHDHFGVLEVTNINGDSTDIYGNIFLDPLFTEPQGGDYTLLPTSPCIDAAHPDSTFDLDNTIADIGIHYYDQASYIEEYKVNNLMTDLLSLEVYPNPFNATILLSFYVPANEDVTLSIYDITGRMISSKSYYVHSGENRLSWDALSHMSSGTYVMSLCTKQHTISKRAVFVK